MKQRSIAIKLYDELMKSEANSSDLKKLNSVLQRQYDFIEKVLNSTIEFINVFDIDLNFLKINDKTEVAMGMTKDEIIGKNFRDLFPNELNGTYFKNLQAAAVGYTIFDSWHIAPSGKTYSTSFLTLKFNDLQYGVLVVARDISEQVLHEKEAEEANAHLKYQQRLLLEIFDELTLSGSHMSSSLKEKIDTIRKFSKH